MSVRIYPIQQNEMSCTDYTVRVNGEPVFLDHARVSAMPFNRRWPGHQRPLDQTELVNFLSLATDEPVHFEITTALPIAELKIRPASLGITPTVKDGIISFTLPRPAYFTVEPCGRNRALHIFADPIAEYETPTANGSVLYFGPGVHDAGLIELHTGQTLFIDEGALVYASVTAKDADDIRILGRGILDNSRNKEEILFEVTNADGNISDMGNAVRRHTLELMYCDRVRIEGITIRDSLLYNIRPIGCRGLDIRNVKLIGNWRYNSDGIDMHNCEDVLIENCFIRTFDDSICVKGFDFYDPKGDNEALTREATYHRGRVYDTFRRVRVRRCVIWNDWGKCLEIGAETKAEEITDILFEDCDCIHVTGPVLDCFNVDYADVHGVTWRNIRIELDETIPAPMIQASEEARYLCETKDYAPPVAAALVEFHIEYSGGGMRRGKNRDLLFEDIRILGDKKPLFSFLGYSDEAACGDIVIRDVRLNGKLLTSPEEYTLSLGAHCKNIRYETSEGETAK